jgi:hypothetical protein
MPTSPFSRVCQKQGREYVDEFQRRHAVKTFHVYTDSVKVWDLDEILLYTGIPHLGDSYTSDSTYLVCTNRTVRDLDTGWNFEVTCNYDMTPYNVWSVRVTSQSLDAVLEKTASNTTGVTARFVADPGKYLFSLPHGDAGENILNRATDPFDPPVMTQRRQKVINLSMLVMSITELGFPTVGQLLACEGKVNSERKQIFSIPDETGAGCDYLTLLLEEINVEKLMKPDGTCDILVTMRIIYDPLGHCQVILNAGYNELVGGVPKKITDGGQVEVSSPRPLKDNGEKVATADLPNGATYLVFPDHEKMDFSVFNFPLTFCGINPTLPP